MTTYLPFEGAGFILTYRGNILLGKRIGAPEFEYLGGKVEGDESPPETAIRELWEELGGPITQNPTELIDRAVILHTFQPFTKKWIWCFKVELTDQEYERVVLLARQLNDWPDDEKREFFKITGPTRKAVSGIAVAPVSQFAALVKRFAQVDQTKNRMKDAKTFNTLKTSSITGRDIVTNEYEMRVVRAFNLVIFEEHADAF